MGEKREPVMVFLLRFQGKTKATKVEVYRATDFPLKGEQWDDDRNWCWYRKPRRFQGPHYGYRIRVGGVWFPSSPKPPKRYCIMTKWALRDLMWRSIGRKL